VDRPLTRNYSSRVKITHAESPESIAGCFEVMHQLRPHLIANEFVSRIESQRAKGYKLARLEADGRVVALAGYRFTECLAWGRMCYVDDIITDCESRGEGYAEALFNWVGERAREAGCGEIHLDSGVHRHPAHRFYLKRGMDITCHHFAMGLGRLAAT